MIFSMFVLNFPFFSFLYPQMLTSIFNSAWNAALNLYLNNNLGEDMCSFCFFLRHCLWICLPFPCWFSWHLVIYNGLLRILKLCVYVHSFIAVPVETRRCQIPRVGVTGNCEETRCLGPLDGWVESHLNHSASLYPANKILSHWDYVLS